jgi:hypothetical protein
MKEEPCECSADDNCICDLCLAKALMMFDFNATEEELQAEIERLQVEYNNNQYQRDRASAYPSIEDQLDTLYHQGYDGWKAMVDEVKNQYPKPGED